MTREEQIWQAAVSICMGSSSTAGRKRYKFIEGARWADKHPNWRSVEDELPPKDVQVLVCAADFMGYCGMWWSHRYDKPKFYGEHEVLTDKNGFSTLRDDKGEPIQVTHWMRIEPPKKGDNQ